MKQNHDHLTYYLKGNTAIKRFNNWYKSFLKKMQFGEMKLEEAKKLQNVFKSNLNEISRERCKSGE